MRSAKHTSEAVIVERLFTFMAEPHFLRGRRTVDALRLPRRPCANRLKKRSSPLFAAVVIGITWMAIVFAAITWRHSDGEPTGRLAVT